MNRVLLVAGLALAGCSARPVAAPGDAREGLLAADRAFAAATGARGLDGWMEFYTADAVRLQMGRTAVQGTAAVRGYDAGLFENPANRLVWTPIAMTMSRARATKS